MLFLGIARTTIQFDVTNHSSKHSLIGQFVKFLLLIG